MISVLLIVIAALLLLIGLIIHGANSLGKGFEGFLSFLTTKMGPGITYRAEKVFPSQIVWYSLAAATLVTAIILRVKGYK